MRGWGEDPKRVEAVIKDNPECLALYREAMKEQGRRTDFPDNVREVVHQECGNSKAYTCERLSKVAPELFEEVKAGRMSANAAAIKAGIRRKPSPLEVCVKNFCKSDNRIETLRAIVSATQGQQAPSKAWWRSTKRGIQSVDKVNGSDKQTGNSRLYIEQRLKLSLFLSLKLRTKLS